MYFTDTLSFNGQLFRVHGPTADGGLAWYLRPSYDTSTTHFHVRWGHFAPGIRNDFNALGFLQDDDRKEIDTNLGHIFFFDTGLVERVRPSVNYNRYISFDQGVLRGWALAPTVTAVLRNRLEFEINRRDEYQTVRKGITKTIKQLLPRAGTAATGARSRPMSARAAISTTIFCCMAAEAHWAFGDSWRLSYNLTRLELSPDLKHESTTIHVFETTYSFNPDLFVRAFLQTNSAIDKENVQVLGRVAVQSALRLASGRLSARHLGIRPTIRPGRHAFHQIGLGSLGVRRWAPRGAWAPARIVLNSRNEGTEMDRVLPQRALGTGAWLCLALALLALAAASALEPAFAHGIGGKDAAFVAATKEADILPFMYLGAKHMFTGYDHLLFLVGVIFFLYRMRDIAIYVTLFSIGHSITLLAGVLMEINVSAYLVDAIIGLSVVYKAFDNLNGFKTVFGVQPNNKLAVAGFRSHPWVRARDQAAGAQSE